MVSKVTHLLQSVFSQPLLFSKSSHGSGWTGSATVFESISKGKRRTSALPGRFFASNTGWYGQQCSGGARAPSITLHNASQGGGAHSRSLSSSCARSARRRRSKHLPRLAAIESDTVEGAAHKAAKSTRREAASNASEEKSVDSGEIVKARTLPSRYRRRSPGPIPLRERHDNLTLSDETVNSIVQAFHSSKQRADERRLALDQFYAHDRPLLNWTDKGSRGRFGARHEQFLEAEEGPYDALNEHGSDWAPGVVEALSRCEPFRPPPPPEHILPRLDRSKWQDLSDRKSDKQVNLFDRADLGSRVFDFLTMREERIRAEDTKEWGSVLSRLGLGHHETASVKTAPENHPSNRASANSHLVESALSRASSPICTTELLDTESVVINVQIIAIKDGKVISNESRELQDSDVTEMGLGHIIQALKEGSVEHDEVITFDSVKRKRRHKMSKHKQKQLRKRQRSMRKRLGK